MAIHFLLEEKLFVNHLVLIILSNHFFQGQDFTLSNLDLVFKAIPERYKYWVLAFVVIIID